MLSVGSNPHTNNELDTLLPILQIKVQAQTNEITKEDTH